jgi:NADH:ubiquinone oxidoreductase subunit E
MDLTICVGENCHLSGADVVAKAVMKLIEAENLGNDVRVRGAFCLGECSQDREVTVRCGERVFHVRRHEAEQQIRNRILPFIRETEGDGEEA